MTEPAKLGFFGPLKTLESATWGIEELPKGSVRAWIDHATMSGVTPEVMRWWFENIDSRTTYNGTDFNGPEVPVYRYWHPFDHIRVRWEKKIPGPDGHIGPGSVIHIQETIGDRYPVDARARVTRFDDEAFNFELLVGGGRTGRRGSAPLGTGGCGTALSNPGDHRPAHPDHRRPADADRPAPHVQRCDAARLDTAQHRGKRRDREVRARSLHPCHGRQSVGRRTPIHAESGVGDARAGIESASTRFALASPRAAHTKNNRPKTGALKVRRSCFR